MLFRSSPHLVATWQFDDENTTVTLRLDVDGRCEISTVDKLARVKDYARCTYWVVGSRVHLRVKGERDGEGFGAMQIERDYDSGALNVRGSKTFTLKRIWGHQAKSAKEIRLPSDVDYPAQSAA